MVSSPVVEGTQKKDVREDGVARENERKKEEGVKDANEIGRKVIELQFVRLEDHVAFVPEDKTLLKDPSRESDAARTLQRSDGGSNVLFDLVSNRIIFLLGGQRRAGLRIQS